MGGTWTLSKSFDSIGALAKPTLDLALVTEIIMTEEARSKFSAAVLTSYLTKTFHGMKVGFLNPAEYRFAPGMCPEIPEERQQLVGLILLPQPSIPTLFLVSLSFAERNICLGCDPLRTHGKARGSWSSRGISYTLSTYL